MTFGERPQRRIAVLVSREERFLLDRRDRALRHWHLQDRVIVDENRTVVF
jgi:hypothetical protein